MLTAADRRKLPELYSQDGKGLDQIAYVKYFSPYSNWTWYATEFDGEDTFFGYVQGHDNEFGYFSLTELSNTFTPFKVPLVERDKSFRPTRLREIV